MGSKDDKYYMSQALEEIKIIIEYTLGISKEEFLKDRKTVDAVVFRLQQMIEHVKSISKEFKNVHPEVPWNDIIGFRNKIVHEYGKADYSTVYESATIDIYQLKELFERNI